MGWGAYRESEGLEQELVSQHVDCQLLVTEGVHARGGRARSRAHLRWNINNKLSENILCHCATTLDNDDTIHNSLPNLIQS